MSDFSTISAVAQAVHQHLSDDVTVKLHLGQTPRLYDQAPEDPVFPYLTYGPMRSEDISGDDGAVTAHTMTLHMWSRYQGRAEMLAILAAIGTAIESSNLSVPEMTLVNANIVYSDIFRAPDGRTLHGVLRANFITDSE